MESSEKSKKPSTYPLRQITMNNTGPLRITATAGTNVSQAYHCQEIKHIKAFFNFRVVFLAKASSSLYSRIVTGSNLRSLPKIPHCCLDGRVCFSPDVTSPSLKLAKLMRLGASLTNTNYLHYNYPFSNDHAFYTMLWTDKIWYKKYMLNKHIQHQSNRLLPISLIVVLTNSPPIMLTVLLPSYFLHYYLILSH